MKQRDHQQTEEYRDKMGKYAKNTSNFYFILDVEAVVK